MKTTLLGALIFLTAGLAQAAMVKVELTNLRNEKGQVVVAVFNQQGYPKTPLTATGREAFSPTGLPSVCPADKKTPQPAYVKAFYTPAATMQFTVDLPPGDYSIGVVHDANLNCKLDGVPPNEGGSFTGGIGTFGPKDWEKSKFNVPANGTAVSIKMKYWM